MMEEETVKIPEVLPLLPVRDMVMYPSVTLPLFLGREMSIHLRKAGMYLSDTLTDHALRQVGE